MTLLRLGVSACLLGEEVRYDGSHKRHAITEALGKHVTFVPICPEVEIGMTIPRPTIRLVDDDGRLVEPNAGTDYSQPMDDFADAWLAKQNLHGFILKRGSPSCGPAAKVYLKGMPSKAMPGRFARGIERTIPGLPTEDEGRLNHPELREHFLERCLALRRWLEFMATTSPANLVEFHARHKYQILSHSTEDYRALGRIAARANEKPYEEYGKMFFQALQRPTTPGRIVNVLHHIQGHCTLDAADKAELDRVIEAYRAKQVPLLVPLTLLSHHVRRASSWIAKQTFLAPYPGEWMVRAQI